MPKKKPIILSTTEGRKKFYQSPEWRTMRRIKLVNNPFCEECAKNGLLIPAVDCHHITDIKDDPTKALKYDNLMSLCKGCHSTITYSTNSNALHPGRFTEIINKKWNFSENSKSVNFSVDI